MHVVHHFGKPLLALFGILTLFASCGRQSSDTEFMPRLDGSRLERNLKMINGDIPATAGGQSFQIPNRNSPNGRKAVRTFLLAYFKSLGFQAEEQCYSNSGCNVEAIKLGQDPSKTVILGAHFDSVPARAADDNASGMAALMETAEALASVTTTASVRFVAFDEEEKRLLGSTAYTRAINGGAASGILGSVIMDSMGYDSDNDGAINFMDCGTDGSKALGQRILNLWQQMGFRFKKMKTCQGRSDHEAFWKKNLAAVMVSENFFDGDQNPCYHKSCDDISRINMPYFKMLSEMVLVAAADLAGVSGGQPPATQPPATQPPVVVPTQVPPTSAYPRDLAGNIYEQDLREGLDKRLLGFPPDGLFRPGDVMTREIQVLTIVRFLTAIPTLAVQLPTQATQRYPDVPPNHRSASFIEFAVANNLIAGYGDNLFHPERTMSRAEGLDFLWRALTWARYRFGARTPDLPVLTQQLTFSDTAGSRAATTAAAMSGYCMAASPLGEQGSAFAPSQALTRDVISAWIVRARRCLSREFPGR